jgi:hypothetical protein
VTARLSLRLMKEIGVTLDRFFAGVEPDLAHDDIMLRALAMVVATALATNERVPDDRLEDAIGAFASAALDLARDDRSVLWTSGRGRLDS